MNQSIIALADRALQAALALGDEHCTRNELHEPPAAYVAQPGDIAGDPTGAIHLSELYVLGASVYRWVTGRPLFEERDPPIPPMELRPDLPKTFSDIIMRLLDTDPGKRYQTVEGLVHDLQELRAALLRGNEVNFTPGSQDFQKQLPAPDHWRSEAAASDVRDMAAEVVLTHASPVERAPTAFGEPLDTLALLRASQALSSEHNADKLRTRIAEVLGSIAGATKVELASWDDDAGDWILPAEDGDHGVVRLAAAPHRVPLSAMRYAERTSEPLLLADGVADPRFAGDPYFRSLKHCSVMVVPVFHQGEQRAVLYVENSASRGAFSVARLDAVKLIAGQLAVSLANAQLYEQLERKVGEQTQELRDAHSQLVSEARRAGMAQIATNVLHNVGNVLTSVNISAHELAARVRQSPADRVRDLANLLTEHAHELATFFGASGKGRLVPGYLSQLADVLDAEKSQLLDELKRLSGSVDHIKNVVAMQQSYAGPGRMLEPVRLTDLVDDAMRIHEAAMSRHGVLVQRDYRAASVVSLDRTRAMQIMVNLLENARQAMCDVEGARELTVGVRAESGSVLVSVRDSGCGISNENLARIFSHGFTTKPDGHGFGLHSCAIAAQEMGGSLTAHSDGPGLGATFVLRLPLET
jgi:signal transduction histidine kinase